MELQDQQIEELKRMKRNDRLHTDKHKEGFVLVLTLFAILILSALIISFTNVTAIDMSLAKNHMCSSKAYYIAEAGIADAINQIRLNGPLADTQWQETFPPNTSDTYNVSVSQNSTVITSVGLASASNFSRALEVKVSVNGRSSPYGVSISQWKEVTQ
jgi:Tfp pilus assembly protein PilX